MSAFTSWFSAIVSELLLNGEPLSSPFRLSLILVKKVVIDLMLFGWWNIRRRLI